MTYAMQRGTKRDEDKTFGERLLEAIAEKGGPITRVGASKWLKSVHGIEVSSTQITKYRNDDEKPRMDQCAQYAAALGVQVNWLYTGQGLKWPMDPLSADEDKLIRLSRSKPGLLTQLLWYADLELKDKRPQVVPLTAVGPNKKKGSRHA